MRIYTEVVYTWDDNKGELVEESSKSYNYEGELTLCHTKREYGIKIPHNHAVADALGIGKGGNNTWSNFGVNFKGSIKMDPAVKQSLGDMIAAFLANLNKDPVGATTDALAETSSVVTGAVDDAVTTVEEVVKDTGDALGVDEAVSSVVDTGQDIGEAVVETGTSLGEEVSGALENQTQNVEGALADNNQPLADAETKINENIADINEDIETGIAANTHTLNDMENTINYNIDQANALLENTQNVVHDASSIINQGFDATINPNNPKALFVNPTEWWKSNISGYGNLKKSYDNVRNAHGNFNEIVAEGIGSVLGGALLDFAEAGGKALDFWPSDGGASDDIRNASNRRYMTNAGDPFGNPSETRRLINKKRDFRDAPSMINAGV